MSSERETAGRPAGSRKSVGSAVPDVFVAIAHPVRRSILGVLARGEATVSALAEPFDVSRSAISQHLSLLLDSGLVVSQKRGRDHYYRLRPENLNEVAGWLRQFEQFWEGKLDALGAYLDSAQDDDEA